MPYKTECECGLLQRAAKNSEEQKCENCEFQATCGVKTKFTGNVCGHYQEAKSKPDAGEFVKYLRSLIYLWPTVRVIKHDLEQAADRIEQLEARINALTRVKDSRRKSDAEIAGHIICVEAENKQLKSRIAELEKKRE